MRIATGAMPPRNDVVIFGWSFCFGWVVIQAGRRGQCRPPYHVFRNVTPSPAFRCTVCQEILHYALCILHFISPAMACISSRSALITILS